MPIGKLAPAPAKSNVYRCRPEFVYISEKRQANRDRCPMPLRHLFSEYCHYFFTNTNLALYLLIMRAICFEKWCYFFYLNLLLLFPASALFHSYCQSYLWTSTIDSTNRIMNRIDPPRGYQRVAAATGSFAEWLRRLPLKPGRPDVLLYSGIEKGNQAAHYAVIDIDIGRTDLQQCADAAMRLRAEFLYSQKRYSEIAFNFTSGDRAAFSAWIKGYRPIVKGNSVTWRQSGNTGSTYTAFRNYLNQVFMYAGTYSLQKELGKVSNLQEMQPGDLFIQGGFPGHAVLVVDMAVNAETGQTVFMLVQSFMPAQNIHILKNPLSTTLSPWYPLTFGEELQTPEWHFKKDDLYRFQLIR